MTGGQSAAWQQVTCKGCGRSYQCTPAEDYYQPAGQDEPAGLDNGVCFACLIAGAGLPAQAEPLPAIVQAGLAALERAILGAADELAGPELCWQITATRPGGAVVTFGVIAHDETAALALAAERMPLDGARYVASLLTGPSERTS